jgi:hypothetical protein
MGADAKWVQDVMADWSDPVFPEYCQQFACNQPVQTWCPLCRAFFCDMHDELYPRRMHDCLRGRAEDVA